MVPIKGGRKTDRSSSSSQDAIPSADSCPVCGSISSSGSFGSGGRNSHNDSSSLQEESAAKVLDTLPTLKPPGEPHPPPRHYMCSSKDIKVCCNMYFSQYRGEEETLGWGARINWDYYVSLANQYTLLQNRDSSRLLGTPVYYSLKLGGGGGQCPPPPPILKLGGGNPPAPLWSSPLQ